MSTTAHLLTADELFRLPEDESRWCELVEGEIVRMSPPGAVHGLVTQNLSVLLGLFVAENDLGRTFAAATGFVVARNPDSVLAPDGSFVRRARIEVLGVPATYFPEAPDLVFEVLSPGDTVREVGTGLLQNVSSSPIGPTNTVCFGILRGQESWLAGSDVSVNPTATPDKTRRKRAEPTLVTHDAMIPAMNSNARLAIGVLRISKDHN